jgi:hypothetical protein
MQVLKTEISLRKKYKKTQQKCTSITIKPFPSLNQYITIVEVDGELFIENTISKYKLFHSIRSDYSIKVLSENEL